MTQALLLGVIRGPKPKASCKLCGGKLVMRRCRPCQKDTPRLGGAAWSRWTRGLCRTVRARCESAGHGRLALATWEGLMLDEPLPIETTPLVADIAALPFSHRRYQRCIDVAVIRAQLETHLIGQGYPNGPAGKWVADNIAGVAAEKIQAQRDRIAAGDVFERRHDAEFVHEAIVEHEARQELKGRLRGEPLETAIRDWVEREAERVRGRWGRPSDEYPRTARVELAGLRFEAPAARVDDSAAEEEAAEIESAVTRRARVA